MSLVNDLKRSYIETIKFTRFASFTFNRCFFPANNRSIIFNSCELLRSSLISSLLAVNFCFRADKIMCVCFSSFFFSYPTGIFRRNWPCGKNDLVRGDYLQVFFGKRKPAGSVFFLFFFFPGGACVFSANFFCSFSSLRAKTKCVFF